MNAGSNTVSVFSVQRRPAGAAPGGELRRVVPGERGRPRRPRLRPQRRERWVGPGLRRDSSATSSRFRDRPSPGPDPRPPRSSPTRPDRSPSRPDGSQLIVTTKANGNDIDVFGVGSFGQLSAAPGGELRARRRPLRDHLRRGRSPGHRRGRDQRPGHLRLNPDGTVTPIDPVGTGTVGDVLGGPAQGFFYASNAGSASESGYHGRLRRRTDPARADARPTREPLTPRPRPAASSSTSRPVGTGSSTSSTSTPRLPDRDRVGHRARRGRRRGHRRLLASAAPRRTACWRPWPSSVASRLQLGDLEPHLGLRPAPNGTRRTWPNGVDRSLGVYATLLCSRGLDLIGQSAGWSLMGRCPESA